MWIFPCHVIRYCPLEGLYFFIKSPSICLFTNSVTSAGKASKLDYILKNQCFFFFFNKIKWLLSWVCFPYTVFKLHRHKILQKLSFHVRGNQGSVAQRECGVALPFEGLRTGLKELENHLSYLSLCIPSLHLGHLFWSCWEYPFIQTIHKGKSLAAKLNKNFLKRMIV